MFNIRVVYNAEMWESQVSFLAHACEYNGRNKKSLSFQLCIYLGIFKNQTHTKIISFVFFKPNQKMGPKGPNR